MAKNQFLSKKHIKPCFDRKFLGAGGRMLERELEVYIDGAYYPKSQAKVSVFDHGLLYGDGVFEGIRAYNGSVFKLKEHVDRLYRSAHMIMLEIPIARE
jgi:hypothetical protein